MAQSQAKRIRAFEAAVKLISRERSKEILAWRNWKNGGVLGGMPSPAYPDMTDDENDAIRQLWMTLDGSACWMWALHMLCNDRPST